jgi:hypothetical protein
MINKNAMPCIQPCHVAGLPPFNIGTSTRNPAKISATPNSASSTTPIALARLRGRSSRTAAARIKISRPVMTKVVTCTHPYGPRASELGQGICSPPKNFPAQLMKVTNAGPGVQPDRDQEDRPRQNAGKHPDAAQRTPFDRGAVLFATRKNYGHVPDVVNVHRSRYLIIERPPVLPGWLFRQRHGVDTRRGSGDSRARSASCPMPWRATSCPPAVPCLLPYGSLHPILQLR